MYLNVIIKNRFQEQINKNLPEVKSRYPNLFTILKCMTSDHATQRYEISSLIPIVSKQLGQPSYFQENSEICKELFSLKMTIISEKIQKQAKYTKK